jgi:dihydrofolate synthase/folylpolyglutamate synthase
MSAAPPALGSDRILERLTRLHPKLIDLSLGRMERLLAALGHPERRLPPVVHVAGTNGKGSTVAYLRAIAEAAGRVAHVYTSPHLVRFHERIRVAGRLIDEASLARLLDACERANGEAPITFFEITTAAAFLAFAETPADVLLLEVGLGGRLDATNVVTAPRATVITPVSLDHMEFLGDTVAKIAAEKAGIIKPGVPLVVGPQTADALDVILARAAELDAPALVHGRHWHARAESGRLVFEDARGSLDLPLPALPGPHQVGNAGMAIAVARLMGEADAAIARGLETVEWPARLQRLTRGPLVAALPDDAELWLDGGHNPGAAEVIAATFRDIAGRAPKPLRIVAGMLTTKDAHGFFSGLAPLGAPVRTVQIPGEANALPAAALADAAQAAGLDAKPAASLDAAVAEIAAEDGPAPRILVCGSLYLAGRVLASHG